MGSQLTSTVLETGSDWPGVEGSMLLLGVIFLAVLGTGVLFGISLLAWHQRYSTRYLLISVAVGTLFVRSLIGIGTVFGTVPMVVHHLLEHSLDFFIAAVILYAVVRNKPTRLGTTIDESTSQEN